MIFLADFSVIKPDFGLLFWTTIIFALFWFLIGRFAFRPIAQALKKREDDIQNSLDEAKKAREEMSNLKAENEALLAEARVERAKILKEAKEAATNFEKEEREKTKEKIQKMMTEAKAQIENQRMAAVTDVKNQIGLMAIEISEKLLKKELKGDAAQEKFVNDLVEDLNIN
jgi:F-type H+-transporting ATPase subunit b